MNETGYPLMPKATAVWLVDNTALTFEQIAEFCGMHLLEIKGIADGDVGAGIRGKNPVTAGELTRESLKEAESDPEKRLKLISSKVKLPTTKAKKRPRYTPLSRRHDRPNAIVWLLRHHPELKDSQIGRLVGTTKPTIQQVRDRSHWNSTNLVPQDPVTLGLCKQVDLDMEVAKAVKQREKDRIAAGLPPIEAGGTLLPTTETTGYDPAAEADEQEPFASTGEISADAVFGPSNLPAGSPAEDEENNGEIEEDARVFARLQSMGQPDADDALHIMDESDVENRDPSDAQHGGSYGDGHNTDFENTNEDDGIAKDDDAR